MTLCAQGSPHGDEMSSPAGLQGSVRVLLPSLTGPLPAGILLGSAKLKTGKPSGSPQGSGPFLCLPVSQAGSWFPTAPWACCECGDFKISEKP